MFNIFHNHPPKITNSVVLINKLGSLYITNRTGTDHMVLGPAKIRQSANQCARKPNELEYGADSGVEKHPNIASMYYPRT